MFFFTSKGQDQYLTSGQGHVVKQKGHVGYHSVRLYETNTMRPSPAASALPLSNQKLLTKTASASDDLG